MKSCAATRYILVVEDETRIVYEFECFDKQARAWKRCAQRGTIEAVTRLGGVAIQSSALVVQASRVDSEGFLRPGTGE